MNTDADLPVVVAVADQERAGPALAFAEEEARRAGCGLRLVHVVGSSRLSTPQTLRAQEVPQHAEEMLRPLVEQAESRLHGQVPVTWEVLRGPVARTIAEVGGRGRLVVIQGEESRRVEGLVTGQVRYGVAARCPSPVVLVPSAWTGEQAGHDAVVVGVDDPEPSPELVRLAAAIAAERDGLLRVLHAWWFLEPIDDAVFTAESARVRSERTQKVVRRNVAAILGERDRLEVRVVHQRPAEALVEESRRADLLVLGRRDARMPFGSHLGPVARAVLRAAACPVMVVEGHLDPEDTGRAEAS